MTKPLTAAQIRAKYLEFFRSKGHAIIPRALLVPQDDATTLFTGSGMQPLIPYLLGAEHPEGTLLADSQTCFRAEDIDEVGDNRHTTFFEMLGNWSLGEYFKAEQLPYFFEFLTGAVGLDPQRLYVTVFAGDQNSGIAKDEESALIWKRLFADQGISAAAAEIGSADDGYRRGIHRGERIFYYDASKNWWSRAGVPEQMPAGEPGGPDSEVFYDFGTEHDAALGEHCHPNCDCGRFLEIGNSVFMEYIKQEDGKFAKLPRRNVDFGGGLERIAAAALGDADVFKIDLLWPLIEKLQQLTGKRYEDHMAAKRIIADHVRAIVFLAADGVVPSNTAQGYVMRRFARRAIRQGLALGVEKELMVQVAPVVVGIYREAYPELDTRKNMILEILTKEERTFRQTLQRGIKELQKALIPPEAREPGEKVESQLQLGGELIFRMFDTYGFPPELSLEEAESLSVKIDKNWESEFEDLMAEQKERSRTATAGQFKGGLADHSEIVTKYHTATHLMYKALRQVLGDHVIQRGSNITAERLRFDFSHGQKMTSEQVAEVEAIVNQQIERDWPMTWREEPTKAALASGVMGAFGERYGEVVKVYTVGDPEGEHYSREICGGPHVEHTGQLAEGGQRFKIQKEESSSAGVRRIKAVLK